jgi:hypothetical protein
MEVGIGGVVSGSYGAGNENFAGIIVYFLA